MARRSTNVIRSDEQTSRRAKAKSNTGHGVVVCVEGEPAKVHTLVIGRLTTGRCEVGVRGLGIPDCISAESPRAVRRQRRHSTVEAGESRWREGRQGIGMKESGRTQDTPLQVPMLATPTEDADPSGSAEESVKTNSLTKSLMRGFGDGVWSTSCRDEVALTGATTSRTSSFPHQEPMTGEPYAGKPPVRFGGRGGPKGPFLPLSRKRSGWFERECCGMTCSPTGGTPVPRGNETPLRRKRRGVQS